MKFLGILLDSVHLEARLPQDKFQELYKCFNEHTQLCTESRPAVTQDTCGRHLLLFGMVQAPCFTWTRHQLQTSNFSSDTIRFSAFYKGLWFGDCWFPEHNYVENLYPIVLATTVREFIRSTLFFCNNQVVLPCIQTGTSATRRFKLTKALLHNVFLVAAKFTVSAIKFICTGC